MRQGRRKHQPERLARTFRDENATVHQLSNDASSMSIGRAEYRSDISTRQLASIKHRLKHAADLGRQSTQPDLFLDPQ
jgi:hypothetical protein